MSRPQQELNLAVESLKDSITTGIQLTNIIKILNNNSTISTESSKLLNHNLNNINSKYNTNLAILSTESYTNIHTKKASIEIVTESIKDNLKSIINKILTGIKWLIDKLVEFLKWLSSNIKIENKINKAEKYKKDIEEFDIDDSITIDNRDFIEALTVGSVPASTLTIVDIIKSLNDEIMFIDRYDSINFDDILKHITWQFNNIIKITKNNNNDEHEINRVVKLIHEEVAKMSEKFILEDNNKVLKTNQKYMHDLQQNTTYKELKNRSDELIIRGPFIYSTYNYYAINKVNNLNKVEAGILKLDVGEIKDSIIIDLNKEHKNSLVDIAYQYIFMLDTYKKHRIDHNIASLESRFKIYYQLLNEIKDTNNPNYDVILEALKNTFILIDSFISLVKVQKINQLQNVVRTMNIIETLIGACITKAKSIKTN